MTAPSIGIRDLLVAAGVAILPSTGGSWVVYISKMPDKQDQVISVYDSGGLAPWPHALLDFPDVTLNIRGGDYEATYNKAKEVKDALLGLSPQTINGDGWRSVTMIGDLAFAGYDEKDRPMFSATFRLIIEPANAAGDNRVAL